MANIKDLCSSKNTQRFTCNGAKVVYNASIIWGAIGPQRMFQHGQVYNAIVYFFLIGVSPRYDLTQPVLGAECVTNLCFVAGCDCLGLFYLSTSPNELGAVHQRPHLLQRCWKYSSCKHK